MKRSPSATSQMRIVTHTHYINARRNAWRNHQQTTQEYRSTLNSLRTAFYQLYIKKNNKPVMTRYSNTTSLLLFQKKRGRKINATRRSHLPANQQTTINRERTRCPMTTSTIRALQSFAPKHLNFPATDGEVTNKPACSNIRG